MAKLGEINYMRNIGEGGRWHAINKPFSDPHCANYLFELGAILHLLPAPPLRLLDVGCGTGWTSRFFARRGYETLGVDICPDMIAAAQEVNEHEALPNLQFAVHDYEDALESQSFDIAVFYDSLHHAVDEVAALRMVFEALKPGGICVTSEPGLGHAVSAASIRAIREFGVTERDMPPKKIIAAARQIGFRKHLVYPHAFDLGRYAYQPTGRILNRIPAWLGSVRRLLALAKYNLAYLSCYVRSGIVVLTK
jgi:SAM-dependent methyltransferase